MGTLRARHTTRFVLVLASMPFLGGYDCLNSDEQACDESKLSVTDMQVEAAGNQFSLFSPAASKQCVRFDLTYLELDDQKDPLASLTPIFHVDNETVVIPNADGHATANGFTLKSHGDYPTAGASVTYYVRLNVPASFQHLVQVTGTITYLEP